MRILILTATLLALFAPLAGCKRSLDQRDVRAFIDKADNTARKRFAPEICELRAKDFKLHLKFQGYEPSLPPTELDMDRKLFCMEAGNLSRLYQYQLERNSIGINVAADRKTARVTAEYVETKPYYEPDTFPRTPDDFREFQVIARHEESVVGMESGDVVFLSTDSDASQSLVLKNSIHLPYN